VSAEEPGYGSEAVDYWQAGFRGVLPLPYGKKFPPPKGWTGYDAPWPSFPDIQAWVEEQPGGNLGLRLPNTVVGIDVDGYNDKRGGLTLEYAETLWGKLPDTVRSTSRIDGVSGIRLYRVPAGTELETVVAFPDKGLAGIEVCQFFHRYVVAWPSYHEGTQRRYRWIDTRGNVSSDIPRPSELPELPAEWIEGLRRKSAGSATVSADALKNLAALPGGVMSPAVASELARAQLALTSGAGSRHDVVLAAVGALFRLAERGGETGIREALDKLGHAFIAAVTKDGSRTREEAQLEWDRMVRGQRIHDLIASTPSVPTLSDLLGKKTTEPDWMNNPKISTVDWRPIGPTFTAEYNPALKPDPATIRANPDHAGKTILHDVTVTINGHRMLDEFDAALMGEPFGISEQLDEFDAALMYGEVLDDIDAAVMAEQEEEGTTQSRTSWGLVDMAAILAGDLKPEEPTVLHRADGKAVFYRGRVNAVVGPPEAGKSWLTFMACSEEMQGRNSILILDFEDTPENVALRCLAIRLSGQGTTKQMLIDHLGYIAPDTMMGEAERDEFFADLDRLNPTVIVVDGVNAAMTLLGLELEKNRDCTQFFQLILKPLALTGAAVITVDHVTKSRESRGNYAIGAQAKRAMTDGAMLGVEAVEQFGRGRLGKLEVSVLKDKPGGVRAIAEKRGDKGIDYLGSVIVDARNEGVVDMRFVFEENKPDEPETMTKGEKDLVVKMIEVSNKMQQYDPDGKGLTINSIVDVSRGRRVDVIAAIDTLVRTHHLEVTSGARGSKIHRLVRPYLGPELDALLGDD
jgi:hypothetical protein